MRRAAPTLLRTALWAALWTLGITIAGTTACEDDPIGTPLSVELVGPGTGVAEEELSVLYAVSGRRLLGVIFSWGDGSTDSLGTAGAQTASGSMRHTYDSSGVFTVRAEAEDALEGTGIAEVTITVQER